MREAGVKRVVREVYASRRGARLKIKFAWTDTADKVSDPKFTKHHCIIIIPKGIRDGLPDWSLKTSAC